VLRDFASSGPEKFCNVTNGVTPRRFLALSTRPARCSTSAIGDGWLKDLDRCAARAARRRRRFRAEWRAVKRANKARWPT
jgi:starch phosphorylase